MSTTTTTPTKKTEPTKVAQAERGDGAEIITRYRYAVRQVEELVGSPPAEVQRLMVAALARAATEAKRRECDFAEARAILADIITRELGQ